MINSEEWKPKNLDQALDDAIGSAINNTAIEEEFNNDLIGDVIEEAIKNIKDSKYIKIEFRKRKILERRSQNENP